MHYGIVSYSQVSEKNINIQHNNSNNTNSNSSSNSSSSSSSKVIMIMIYDSIADEKRAVPAPPRLPKS